MLSQFAAIALSLAAGSPLPVEDWYYVDSDKGHANISFIDKDSIRTNAAGNTEAVMFSVLARDENDAAAYRFVVEFKCAEGTSRLMTGEAFTAALKSSGPADLGADWEPNDSGTQGQSFLNFVCTRGATAPNSVSLGAALPLAKGRSMLAERAAKGS